MLRCRIALKGVWLLCYRSGKHNQNLNKTWERLIGRLCGIYQLPQSPAFPFPQASNNSRTGCRSPPSSIIYDTLSSKERKMAQSFSNNINSLNTIVNLTSTVADVRSNILAWLSPLEPRIRHKDIQDRRVENIGEWVLETEEFESWYASSGGSGSDNAVLFCYGDPGVGKTFNR